MKQNDKRLRRARKARGITKRLGVTRISVHKTNQHMYAQLIDATGAVLAAASTLSKDYKSAQAADAKLDPASWVGSEIAKKATGLGLKAVAFDRSGFKYHGRVMRLADAARAAGLEF